MKKKQYVQADLQIHVLTASDVITASPIVATPENLIDIDMFDANPDFNF
jgi:hypothetical protein